MWPSKRPSAGEGEAVAVALAGYCFASVFPGAYLNIGELTHDLFPLIKCACQIRLGFRQLLGRYLYECLAAPYLAQPSLVYEVKISFVGDIDSTGNPIPRFLGNFARPFNTDFRKPPDGHFAAPAP